MKAVHARNQKIASEISRADEKIASLKASEPIGERDPDRAARAAKSALFEPLRQAQERLKQVQQEFKDTPPPTGWRMFNPWAHQRFNAAKTAVDIAHSHVEASKPHHVDIDVAEGKGRNSATLTARAHAEWDAGPGRALRALEKGVQSIRDALENRDFRVRDSILAGGLEAALELIRKREADEQRQREIEAARTAKRGNVYGFPERGNQSGMAMPAPRMR